MKSAFSLFSETFGFCSHMVEKVRLRELLTKSSALVRSAPPSAFRLTPESGRKLGFTTLRDFLLATE
ncbi:unnamed protein product [Arabis nemorensis]|uniref:Uncharacterized protein n=1 Tax=Arabis nemorensis TaxID=586526 RepID=A0A565AUL0_9BRAS|nr:unnamed protein product [Arabis nemorensis]